MELKLEIDDVVQCIHTQEIGKVVAISIKWGWFRVQYNGGRECEYRMYAGSHQSVRKVTDSDYCVKCGKSYDFCTCREEWADALLKLENSGVTDYWRE